jgi:hypothetical protein
VRYIRVQRNTVIELDFEMEGTQYLMEAQLTTACPASRSIGACFPKMSRIWGLSAFSPLEGVMLPNRNTLDSNARLEESIFIVDGFLRM